jgi:hypothetical protein
VVHRLGARVGHGLRRAPQDVAGPEGMPGLGARADAYQELAALPADRAVEP